MARRVLLLMVCGLIVMAGCQSPAGVGMHVAGWRSLFDGKTLDGWKASENKDTFRVQDGMIVAHGARSHLFYVGPVYDANFANFEFMADVMTKPGANSGIYFHTAYQQTGWPAKGYEVQVNNTHSDWRKTGSLYSVVDVNESPPGSAGGPPAKNIVYVRKPLAQDNKWFTEYIRVRNGRILIRINGDTVVDYTEPDSVHKQGQPKMPGRKLSSGTFALQGHDPGSEVWFRNIKVRPLR